jgi:hypothetical protein
MHRFIINRFDSPGRIEANKATNETNAPPNIHNDKLFMIKLQAAVNSGDDGIPPHIFMYDRRKSFQVYLMAQDDAISYQEAASAIKTTGWKGLKMYRWAKRTGDFELRVCFDKAPEKDPQW